MEIIMFSATNNKRKTSLGCGMTVNTHSSYSQSSHILGWFSFKDRHGGFGHDSGYLHVIVYS